MRVIPVPEGARQIMEELNRRGFEAWVVGGCVRDSLLGRYPEDWDITTSARPSQVKDIFGRTVDTGIAHGTVTVMLRGAGYEVTTYRVDGEYLDGRHPESVEFSSSLLEDLKRRDFTINAMAYSIRDGLVDAFDGQKDLEKGVIRCVGDAVCRFDEDALRILRAIRFSAQLGFSIEEKTKEAIHTMAPHIEKVSRERIAAELTKLLLSDHPESMALVYEMGISPYVSETFYRIRGGGEPEKLARISLLPARRAIRWAGFLRLSSPEESESVMRELKMDNAATAAAKTLVSMWRQEISPDKFAVREVMSRLTPELYEDLLTVKEVFTNAADRESLEEVKQLSRQIYEAGDCVRLKDLAVTGRDLIAAGKRPGPEVGEILDKMFRLVLEKPECNTKQCLMELFCPNP